MTGPMPADMLVHQHSTVKAWNVQLGAACGWSDSPNGSASAIDMMSVETTIQLDKTDMTSLKR